MKLTTIIPRTDSGDRLPFDRKIFTEPKSELTPIAEPPWRRRARPKVCEIDGFAMIYRMVHIYSPQYKLAAG